MSQRILSILAVFFAIGAAVCEECVLGTRVREGGIQMLCTTTPWSRIFVKHWKAREGGFALHLVVLGPRIFGMGVEAESEVTIPVTASERPELEAFFGAHAARAR